jgi:hexosaminidase
LRARLFDGDRPVGPPLDQRVDGAFLRTRASQQLQTCSERAVINLEDDAPLKGPRAAFLVDILNPCWIWPKADLDGVKGISASVGQLPFNFAFASDSDARLLPPAQLPKLAGPATPYGELEVRLDGCAGAPVAVLLLKPAVRNPAVTTLPPAALPAVAGRHDLCFSFTGKSVDPLWVISRVRLLGEAPKRGGRS